MPNKTLKAAQQLDAASKMQSSQALIVQNFSNSVLAQPNVDFSGFSNLTKFQDQINNGLKAAKGHANTYLNVIQPNLINNVTNIKNYYNLHNAVATTLPPGSTVSQWTNALNALKEQSQTFQTDAKNVLTSLQNLQGDLSTDAGSFAQTVSNLNAAVDGDNGVLASLNGDLKKIQSKIDGAIAGAALSGLAIAGGIFLAAVGAIAELPSAGTSTALIAGGAVIIAAGVGGEVASGLALNGLYKDKRNILVMKSELTSEVTLATGVSSGFQSLNNQAMQAVSAASQMENAWSFLKGDLGSLITDLEQGIKNTGQVRTIFLTAANSAIRQVLEDTNIIEQQLTGVKNETAPAGTTIDQFVLDLTKKKAA